MMLPSVMTVAGAAAGALAVARTARAASLRTRTKRVSRILRHTLDLTDSAAESPRPERATMYLVATLDDLAGEIARLRTALAARTP